MLRADWPASAPPGSSGVAAHSARVFVWLSLISGHCALPAEHDMQPEEEEDEEQRDYRKHEKRRKTLQRELKDLTEFQTPEFLNREQRRVAAAAAAQARLDGRDTGSSGRQPGSGQPRGRRRMPPLYDEDGTHLNSGRNLCDCLNPDCPGCHFPCKGCGSNKCGKKCRAHRKWMYTQVVEQQPFDESMVMRTKQV